MYHVSDYCQAFVCAVLSAWCTFPFSLYLSKSYVYLRSKPKALLSCRTSLIYTNTFFPFLSWFFCVHLSIHQTFWLIVPGTVLWLIISWWIMCDNCLQGGHRLAWVESDKYKFVSQVLCQWSRCHRYIKEEVAICIISSFLRQTRCSHLLLFQSSSLVCFVFCFPSHGFLPVDIW